MFLSKFAILTSKMMYFPKPLPQEVCGLCYSLLKSRDLEPNPGKQSYTLFKPLGCFLLGWGGFFGQLFQYSTKHANMQSAT